MIDYDRYRVLLANGEGAVPEGFERVRGREALRVLDQAFRAPRARERLVALCGRRTTGHFAYARFGEPELARVRAWLVRMVDAEPVGLRVLRRNQPSPAELPLLPEPPRSAPRPPPQAEIAWIEIELLDQDGEPFVGTPYSIAKGEDTVSQGGLNRFGSAYVDRIDPGSYKIVIGRTAEEEPVEPTDWITVELMHESGLPAAGERFVLTDASGTTREGQLDAHGRAVLFDVVPGECTVAFPGLASPTTGTEAPPS